MNAGDRMQLGFAGFQLTGMLVLYAMSSTAASELHGFDPAGWRPLFAVLMGLSASAALLCVLVLAALPLRHAFGAVERQKLFVGRTPR